MKNTWMLGNMTFISRVEQDISLVRFALTREISWSTREINFIFPNIYVLFSLYLSRTDLWFRCMGRNEKQEEK